LQLTESIFRTIVEISPYPVYMCTGDDMIVAVANDATLKAWGKDKSVIGMPFKQALPEMEDQPFFGLLQHVYKTGEDYYTDNDRADFLMDGKMETYYFKFSYQPMRSADGKIFGVVCFATDVTELERARQAVEESQLTLYNMVKQAPVGLCIIKSDDLVVQVVNDAYLELVGKNAMNWRTVKFGK
jgi:PAS domain S-box-containing protein